MAMPRTGSGSARRSAARPGLRSKDKLKALHSELDAGVRTAAGYTVDMAVTDWLAEGLPGRAAKTVEVYRDALRPVLAVIGKIPLRDLTVQDARTALAKMAVTHSTPTLQKAHNCLTRALRHAEGRDLVRRNVSALVDTPHGREGIDCLSVVLRRHPSGRLLRIAVLKYSKRGSLHPFCSVAPWRWSTTSWLLRNGCRPDRHPGCQLPSAAPILSVTARNRSTNNTITSEGQRAARMPPRGSTLRSHSLGNAGCGTRDSIAGPETEHSNVSVPSQVAGSLTGSQRPQIQGYTGPQSAASGTAKQHVRRHLAPPSHTSKMPPKQ